MKILKPVTFNTSISLFWGAEPLLSNLQQKTVNIGGGTLTILIIVANITGSTVPPHELNISCRFVFETHGNSWPEDCLGMSHRVCLPGYPDVSSLQAGTWQPQ